MENLRDKLKRKENELKQEQGDEENMASEAVGRFIEIQASKDSKDKIVNNVKQGVTTTYSAFIDFSTKKALVIAAIVASIPAGQTALIEMVKLWLGV